MIVEVRPARVQYGIRPSMGLQLPMRNLVLRPLGKLKHDHWPGFRDR